MARIAARQIYILPTPTGLLYALTVFVMLLGSLNYQNNLGLLFAFFLAAVGLVAMHHCWYNLLHLAISVRPGAPVFAGTAAEFEVTLCNERAGARYDLRIADAADQGGGPIYLGAKDQEIAAVRHPTARRGLLRLMQITVSTRHPMHLFRAWCYPGSQASCLVYPSPAAAAPPPVPDSGGTTRPAKNGSTGADDYTGSREYRSGDSPKHLDWKVLARERGLVVKQFSRDDGLDVWVDWNALPSYETEQRISVLTRQILDAADTNLRFGMRLPGFSLGLGYGDAHRQECLRALALFDPGQLTERQ